MTSAQYKRLREEVSQIQDAALRRKAERLLGLESRTLRGWVSRADSNGKVGWIREEVATGQGPMGKTVLDEREIEVEVDKSFMHQAPIKKRTNDERAESLARKFWATCRDDPSLAPLVLKELQAEEWRQGRAVSYDDMRAAAVELLKKAAAAAEEKKRG